MRAQALSSSCSRRAGAVWAPKQLMRSRRKAAATRILCGGDRARVYACRAWSRPRSPAAAKASTIARTERPIAMAVHLAPPDPASLLPVAGIALGTAMAGVRKANRRDLLVV